MPVRQIPPQFRSLTGRFASGKVRRAVAFESSLERDLELLLEFDPRVLEFEEQLVDGLKEDEVQYIIGGGSETFVNFFGEQYEEISRVAAKKGLKTLYVGNPGEAQWLSGRVAGVFGDSFQVRILDTLPKTIVQTVIRFDTVTFYAFGNPPLVYFFKSKTVAEDYKKFFMMLWDMAK